MYFNLPMNITDSTEDALVLVAEALKYIVYFKCCHLMVLSAALICIADIFGYQISTQTRENNWTNSAEILQ